ncbi:hypothetical protein [Actinoplanes solisilvae]|uniref:hypothetical protein n=1 Tax=Actinoplanes solisilvae TaxID=2486853 RepID=UPI000FD88587|nr:hypothetical protein [Actinoplanes solisilvae]
MPVTELIKRWEAGLEQAPRWALFGGLAVLVVASVGTAALQVFGGEQQASANRSVGAFASPTPSGTSVNAAPKPSTTPVRNGDDLGKVCAGWYFPGAPRYAGKAPHQISIGVRDQAQEPAHRVKAALDVPYTLKEKTRAAWMPSNPAKSQLMACVTLSGVGSAVKTCPPKLTLKRGTYALTVIEVATGRKLVQRQVTGDVVRCPNAVPLGTGDTIATTVSDGQLYRLLDKYVVSQSTVSRK